ncbi:hypothetical protein [Prosthecobacter sp.]|uniref:hypothetical protein n=1 Tax=Prosthecobacter sp. TaxID=1965333 RepID=UPI0037832A64
MKKKKRTFPAEPKRLEGSQLQAGRRASAARQIELEYKLPEGSDAVKKVANCVCDADRKQSACFCHDEAP